MKYNELHNITQKSEPKPDTYEAGMALNQLLKIGTHAIKIHNMIDDRAEMEAWVAKKIDLASNYVKSVHGYTAGSKAGTYDDDGMSEDADIDANFQSDVLNFLNNKVTQIEQQIESKPALTAEEKENKEFALKLFDFVQKKLEQKDDNTPLEVPKSMVKTEDAGDKFFDYENSDEYADNVEKYGDVDKTPLTPMERQQFAKWLMDSANDYAGRALEDGVEEIGDDLSDIEDQYHKFIPKIKQYLKQSHAKGNLENFASDVLNVEEKFGDEDMLMNDEGYRVAKDFSQHAMNYEAGLSKLKSKGQDYTVKTIRGVLDLIDDDPHISSAMLVFQTDFEGTPLQRKVSRVQASESVSEDAGEGHMSKSQLYQTAKMSIELLDMIRKGDDLEGWVQTKLNLAADYLQAVYHYEDYQKLNPYREELDSSLMQRHAGIIQKHLDEILERKCKAEDVDTKPGMMRILKKRVNEVEKEIAKENRKDANEGDMEQDKENPIAKPYINKPEWKALHDMDDKIIHAYLKHKEHKTNEAALEEGKLKDWAKSLAMAGIFVAGMAGVGSINDAINNSVPAIQAMNTALEMAKERGDDNLVAQIEKDLKGAKLRLDIGKDLNQVKYLQDKYEKFIATESLAYESKLAMMLNQHIK